MHFPSRLGRSLKWMAALLLALLLACVLFITVFGWNWLRAPIERQTLQATGRVLQIEGALGVDWGWPALRLHAGGVKFANPEWAQEKQMLSAQDVTVSVDLPQLLSRRLAFPEVRLDRAVVFLEHSADGRKSWLLDRDQQDEGAHARIGRIVVNDGALAYDEAAQKTQIRSLLRTRADGGHIAFSAQGRFRGLPFKAQGSGGSVLALRDTDQAYPLKADATIGRTRVRADGSVTGLLALQAVDMQMALSGDSLEQLYPILGIAFPATRAYTTQGRLLHSGASWRYENFNGRFGASDLSGSVQVSTGGKRPLLSGDVRSQLLALEDLGPLIGARPGSVAQAAAQARVLPDMPFHTERWDTVDADVRLQAKRIARAKELPLEDLDVRLKMQDKVLTLSPLNFGIAGGALKADVVLNGHGATIQARTQLRARKLQLSKLFPAIEASKTSLGELNGEVSLSGSGDSVGAMLGGADGHLGLVVADGQISRLLMEKAGLHVWEIITLSLAGDKQVKLRCVVADFDVQRGVMQTNALVLDTEVTTLLGSGSIDLGKEQLNLLLSQRTKTTSPLALRSPIHVRGSFAQPSAGVDKGPIALRAAGAIALGSLNPLLALIPLVDAGPGADSDCGQLLREAKTLSR